MEKQKEELTIVSLIKILHKNKRFISVFVFIAVIIIMAYSYIIPTQYKSSATILPPDKASSSGGLSGFLQNLSSGGAGLSLGGVTQSKKSQIFQEIILSREVAVYITNKLNLTKYPQFQTPNIELTYELVKSMLDVYINQNGLIVVSANVPTTYFPGSNSKDTAALLSAAITNAAIEGLDSVNRNKSMSSANQVRKYIERILYNKRHELDSIENELQIFQSGNKVLSLPEQSQAILTEAINLGAELAKTEIELKAMQLEYESNAPIIKQYTKKAEVLKNQYDKIQTGGLIDNDKFSIPLSKIPEITRIYTNLVRNKKIVEQVVIYLESQKYEEYIQEEKDVPTVETLDNAIVPLKKDSPNRKLMVLLTIILSFVCSYIIVFVKSVKQGAIFLKNDRLETTE